MLTPQSHSAAVAKQFLGCIKLQIQQDPYLADLTVFRIALRELEAGCTAQQALGRIIQDADKITNHTYRAHLHAQWNCCRAHDEILRVATEQDTVAQIEKILYQLEEWNMDLAIYERDVLLRSNNPEGVDFATENVLIQELGCTAHEQRWCAECLWDAE